MMQHGNGRNEILPATATAATNVTYFPTVWPQKNGLKTSFSKENSELLCFASRWISGETGLRSDVPHNMIYPVKETRPNLHIATELHVKYVTFDEYVVQFSISALRGVI